jgi:hypothetical protein
MPENAVSIELGQWLRASASGNEAVLALAGILIAWSIALVVWLSRKKAAGNSSRYAGFWPWPKRLSSILSIRDDDQP